MFQHNVLSELKTNSTALSVHSQSDIECLTYGSNPVLLCFLLSIFTEGRQRLDQLFKACTGKIIECMPPFCARG